MRRYECESCVFFQAEDGIRDLVRSRGLGDVYKRQALSMLSDSGETENYRLCYDEKVSKRGIEHKINALSLIHI